MKYSRITKKIESRIKRAEKRIGPLSIKSLRLLPELKRLLRLHVRRNTLLPRQTLINLAEFHERKRIRMFLDAVDLEIANRLICAAHGKDSTHD